MDLQAMEQAFAQCPNCTRLAEIWRKQNRVIEDLRCEGKKLSFKLNCLQIQLEFERKSALGPQLLALNLGCPDIQRED